MMSPATWLSREEIVALGWTLLHFCWQGMAVAVAFSLVDQASSRATAKVRYAIALGAFLVMPAIVVGTFALELQTTPQRPAHTLTIAPVVAQTGPILHLQAPPRPILHELPLGTTLEASTNWLTLRADRILPWVDALWLAGALLLALRSLGGLYQLGLVRQHAERMVPHEVELAFQRLCQQIHVGRKVVLRASDYVISPLAMGVWRATVILPISAILELPREELEAVIAHELGHIRRWDYLWNLLQTAVESLLFFHPAVWWLSRTVRDRREVCCDEIGVQACADPAVYARALLRLEEQRTVQLRMAMAFGGCGGSLLQRIRKVLGEDMAMESKMTSGISAAVVGALVIALLLGPKIGEAAQPAVHRAMAILPASFITVVAPQDAPPAPRAPLAPPAPLPKLSALLPAPLVISIPQPQIDPQSFVAPTIAINANAIVTSLHQMELQLSTGTGASQGAGTGSGTGSGAAYIDGMRDAGYPLNLNDNLDSIFALRSVGVTPEYAKSMSSTPLGKPSMHELITLKSMGVTPDYLAAMSKSGIAPKDFHELVTEKSLGITPEYATEMKQKGFGDLGLHELITMKSLGVTPEFAAEMKRSGFGDLNVHELVTMKSMGVTPEYAAEMKQKGFGNLSANELVSMKSLGVTPEYAAEMKQSGFGDLGIHELISLKAQGMTPEYARWLKQKFPQASADELKRATVFHIDDNFVAQAKAHGFDDKNLDKLLRLKMTGLLDDQRVTP
jgi:beta-lactamase regulating signal transducer with metallopeptidase domain